MPRKRLDLTKYEDKISISAQGVYRRLMTLAHRVRWEWLRLANQKLAMYSDNTRNKYKAGIVIEGPDKRGVRIILRGRFPNWFEQGLGPTGIGSTGAFDIRVNVLKGKESQAIPITRSSAQVQGIATGMPRDKPQATRIAKMAAALTGTTSHRLPDGAHRTQWGGRMKSEQIPKLLQHHTDRLEGMTRKEAGYSKGTRQTGGHTTFRMMSWKGKPWIHPGIPAHNMAALVESKLKQIVRDEW